MKLSVVLMIAIIAGIIFYLWRGKHIPKSVNTSNDSNKNLEILNPQKTGGQIVSIKPALIDWDTSNNKYNEIGPNPLNAYLTKQDNRISNVDFRRGDIYTAQDVNRVGDANQLGVLSGDFLPDNTLIQNINYLNAASDVPLAARQDSPLPNLSIQRTNNNPNVITPVERYM